MEEAIVRLRQHFQLPASWKVEAMLVSRQQKLLAKTELHDPRVLDLFNDLIRHSTDARYTRDRRGRPVPKGFTAVRAIQIMNAPTWSTYVRRRDRIGEECRSSRARHDERHWEDNLNGSTLCRDPARRIADYTQSPPLLDQANECWLLHGTSHAAAEGITTEDFDMTRADPAGLFGAGMYFAESVSKSDEYVEPKTDSQGRELFPFLFCRVTLGQVYYCDDRAPDRHNLVDRCVKQDWHSVLGDRKKTSGTFREFIIYDSLQAFPAFIVYYTRQYASGI